MRKMQQTRAAIFGTLFLLVCTVGVAIAEGEAPPPPDGSALPPILAAEQSVLPTPTTTPEPSTAVDNGSATAEPEPDAESWLPVVNSLQPGYWDASILPVQGIAMYYNPDVFVRVMDFRFKSNHISACDECIGYVALLRGGDLDRRVWLQREGQRMEGPFWVVDAAAFKHITALLSRNWVVAVDYDTAMRWRMAGPVPITVYDADSPEAQVAAADQLSAAQTYALVGFLYKCAILPLETNNYQVLDALADSAACLTSTQPDTDTVDADNTND